MSSRAPSNSKPWGKQGPSETLPEAAHAWMGRGGVRVLPRSCSEFSACLPCSPLTQDTKSAALPLAGHEASVPAVASSITEVPTPCRELTEFWR